MARLLIVDDDPQIRRAVRRILELAGHTLSETGEGRTAISMHAVQPFDLVITDMRMPGCTGLELMRHLQQTEPAVKVIIMSGGDQADALNLAQIGSSGTTRTLQKPFTIDELKTLVRELLGEANRG